MSWDHATCAYMVQEGDTVLLAPPCGTFMAPAVNDAVVLITAGVGITPAWALLQTYGSDNIKAAVHVDKSPERDAFRTRFTNAGVDATVFYTGEKHETIPDMTKVAKEVAEKAGVEPTYYVVGPKKFMRDVMAGLDAVGVQHKYSEVYGTGSLATPEPTPVVEAMLN